jgi:hypothetical protein
MNNNARINNYSTSQQPMEDSSAHIAGAMDRSAAVAAENGYLPPCGDFLICVF